MTIINFNDNFSGFEDGEDIFLDTGVLLAYLNKYDCWSTTINTLFIKYILETDNELHLYISAAILNEITNLLGKSKPTKEYMKKHPDHSITDEEIVRVEKEAIEQLRILIENDVIEFLNIGKEAYLKQLELYKTFGAADAINALIANEHGISFLTVDNKLMENLKKNTDKIKNIHNLYYTTPEYTDY